MAGKTTRQGIGSRKMEMKVDLGPGGLLKKITNDEAKIRTLNDERMPSESLLFNDHRQSTDSDFQNDHRLNYPTSDNGFPSETLLQRCGLRFSTN